MVIGFHRLGQERIRSAASKFKYQSLVQKFSSYKAYWARTQREIEDIIHLLGAGAEYSWVNGAILHNSERA